MRLGIPKERQRNEHRVGLTPFAVYKLTGLGHEVYVEHEAGLDCHFLDEDYTQAGAKVVYNADEVFQRSDLVCRVGPLAPEEIALLQPGCAVCGFLQLAAATHDEIQSLSDKQATLLGYEIAEHGGRRSVLVALAEIAGHLSIHTAAHLLGREQGGRGILLGGIPGISPATVVVLGAGTGGRAAARLAASCGAQVILLDTDLERLRRAQLEIPGQPATALASQRNLKKFTGIADVLVGASLEPAGKSPAVVTEEMVRAMKRGSVIFDMSIGLGGCIATSRPTTLEDPTFTLHGVTHYCVPNMTANVPRTASRAMTMAALPYLTNLAERGIADAIRFDEGLRSGIFMFRGKIVHPGLAELCGKQLIQLSELVQ